MGNFSMCYMQQVQYSHINQINCTPMTPVPRRLSKALLQVRQRCRPNHRPQLLSLKQRLPLPPHNLWPPHCGLHWRHCCPWFASITHYQPNPIQLLSRYSWFILLSDYPIIGIGCSVHQFHFFNVCHHIHPIDHFPMLQVLVWLT